MAEESVQSQEDIHMPYDPKHHEFTVHPEHEDHTVPQTLLEPIREDDELSQKPFVEPEEVEIKPVGREPSAIALEAAKRHFAKKNFHIDHEELSKVGVDSKSVP